MKMPRSEHRSLLRSELRLPTRILRVAVGALAAFAHFTNAISAPDIDDWIRAQAAAMPALPLGVEAGSPKFKVLRFNSPPLLAKGGRYGGVRILCPTEQKMDLIWMFSDVTNIDEYRLIPIERGSKITEGVRQIYMPTANMETEEGGMGGHPASVLPRPWDLFQLHMLGVPAAALVPGREYVIWFQFSDRRPADILMAATFISPPKTLEPADLPPVFGLPPQLVVP